MGTESTDAHDGAVECLLYINDGSILVSGGKDSMLKVWDAVEGYALLETIAGHKGHVLAVDFCVNVEMLASAGRELQIKIWDFRSHNVSQRTARADHKSSHSALFMNIDAHRGDVTVLRWDSTGETLFSGARDNEIKVWDRLTGKLLRTISGHKGDIRQLVLLNKEKLLLSASADSTVKLWELQKGLSTEQVLLNDAVVDNADPAVFLDRILGQFHTQADTTQVARKDRQVSSHIAHEEDIAHMMVNPRAPLMATSSHYNSVRIWNIQDLTRPQLVHELVGHRAAVTAVQMIDSDSIVVSASADFSVHLHDIASLQRVAKLWFGASVLTIAIDLRNRLLYAGGNDYDIKVYSIDARAPNCYKQVAQLQGHSGKVETLALSPNGQFLVSGGHDFNLLLWLVNRAGPTQVADSPVSLTPHERVDAHHGHVTCVAFNEAGDKFASVGADHALFMWSVINNKLRRDWWNHQAHDSVVSAVVFGRQFSQRYVFTASWDNTIKMWAVGSTGATPVQTFRGHTARVNALSLTADGRRLLSAANDFSVRLWNLDEPFQTVCVYSTASHELGVNSVFGGQKVFITGSENGLVRVWPQPTDQFADYFTEMSVSVGIADGGYDSDEEFAVRHAHGVQLEQYQPPPMV
eukprot:TRINITY_DN2810_c0_g1_i2.p1 TRINITY_DN2810_c0_g1~~TRINITY_DN2810_c0_g1_i2.p1  ORF type:complete len:636 (-),score=117.27 TRINITY_DN2810_c0_g1_i2:27-1934(-)